MKILITGAGGMLGTDLVEALRGHFDIVGLGLFEAPHLKIPYRCLDLTDSRAVEDLWFQEKPELVFHLAAMTHVDDCEIKRDEASRANVLAVKNVANASKKINAPVVFFSTDFVFNGKEMREYTEEDVPDPKSHYAVTKAQAEKFLQNCGCLFVIFRICWLYGLRGRSFPRAILNMAAKQKEVKVVADQIGRPSYTRDISSALASLLRREPAIFKRLAGQIFHLANAGTASWADFAEEVLKLAGHKEHTVKRIGWRDFKRDVNPDSAERPEHAILSLQKTRDVLGIQLRPWQEGLRDFIQEYQDHPIKV